MDQGWVALSISSQLVGLSPWIPRGGDSSYKMYQAPGTAEAWVISDGRRAALPQTFVGNVPWGAARAWTFVPPIVVCGGLQGAVFQGAGARFGPAAVVFSFKC